MNNPAIAYYVSGHGFGHARRSVEIMRHLLTICPQLLIHIRSTAAAHLFAGLPAERFTLTAVELDSGAVEHDPITIDANLTIDRLRKTIATADAVVDAEAAFLIE